MRYETSYSAPRAYRAARLGGHEPGCDVQTVSTSLIRTLQNLSLVVGGFWGR